MEDEVGRVQGTKLLEVWMASLRVWTDPYLLCNQQVLEQEGSLDKKIKTGCSEDTQQGGRIWQDRDSRTGIAGARARDELEASAC